MAETRRSRREVIRLGATAAGAVWAAPVLITAAPVVVHSLPVCCHSKGHPKGCDVHKVVLGLTDGAKWYLVEFDTSSGKFKCGNGIGMAPPTTNPVVLQIWQQATATKDCPPGLVGVVNSDGSVTIMFPTTLSVGAWEVENGGCTIYGVPPHRGATNDCSYLPVTGKGFITMPTAPSTCTSIPIPSD